MRTFCSWTGGSSSIREFGQCAAAACYWIADTDKHVRFAASEQGLLTLTNRNLLILGAFSPQHKSPQNSKSQQEFVKG
jgi:hypothetical protein